MSKKVDELRDALAETGVLIPYKVSSTKSKVDLLCKEVPSQGKNCLVIYKGLLTAADNGAFEDTGSIYLAKRFLIKNGEMAFGWWIIVESKTAKDLDLLISSVINILSALRIEPQEPEAEAPQIVEPTKKGPKITVVRNDLDEDGKKVVITEMPLPHVTEDKNRPNEFGKGASYSGDGNFHPAKRRR